MTAAAVAAMAPELVADPVERLLLRDELDGAYRRVAGRPSAIHRHRWDSGLDIEPP